MNPFLNRIKYIADACLMSVVANNKKAHRP